MVLPASRLTELKTWRGPTRSSSSTGGTTTTTIRRLVPDFLDARGMSRRNYAAASNRFARGNARGGRIRRIYGAIRRPYLPRIPTMKQSHFAIAVTALLGSTELAMVEPSAERSFARIAVLHPHDGDTVDFEAGYIRHLEFHRQAKDQWVWYGWSIWAGERQRWFVYATFGHSA